MNQVTVVARAVAKPGREEEVRRELLRLVEETRKEEGCINYDLHEASETPGVFLFYENWRSREDLDRHAQSAHIREFRARAHELLVAPTEISLWEMVPAARAQSA